MQMNGEWVLFSDAIERPVIRSEALANDGSWVRVPFLVDTGADRTVFSAGILALLRLQPVIAQERLSGLGGVVSSLIISTQIWLTREDAGKVVFRSQFAAVTDMEALDISVRGRDLTNLFAVIVDRPRHVVCLLGQRHRYTIEQV
jgi:predicted aspartyl protease